MLASTSQKPRFAKTSQVRVASDTVSISFAGFPKVCATELKHAHDEEEQEDVDGHDGGNLLQSGEIKIQHGSALSSVAKKKLLCGVQVDLDDQTPLFHFIQLALAITSQLQPNVAREPRFQNEAEGCSSGESWLVVTN